MSKPLMARGAHALFLITSMAAVAPAMAESSGQSMLVLDASGSMWGQIDGRTKIEIAREAVNGMLADWRGGEVGLMAYGHRRKGDCADIELLSDIGALDAAALGERLAALNPKGMTPISDAVRQAAEALRSSEQKATVILISDGEETCNADPCAAAEALEQAGVDFTAHVIGFDVAQGSQAQKQLQCIASRTGGRYTDASSAAALNEALDEVAGTAGVTATETGSWLPGFSLESETSVYLDPNGEESAGNHDFTVDQTAEDCQALCQADAGCAGWHYEPTGSFFIDHPRCFLKGYRFAVRQVAQDEGWVAGVKPGVKLILEESAAP